jgi:hypothetical protein
MGGARTNNGLRKKSVLVFGITRTAAAALGRQFKQNAIVYVSLHRPAELVHLPDQLHATG